MIKAISYSLFGYQQERKASCFDFNSYLRGLMINIRMNRLLYPSWINVLHTDESTYAAFRSLFDNISNLHVVICEPSPLCLAMLWRMKPIFEIAPDRTALYSHVICRDLDSPATYREAQAVQHWINHDKTLHAITDSVSHNLPLMGGMIGIRPKYFTEHTHDTWQKMIAMCGNEIDWSNKGADQTFLNKFIYPIFGVKGRESITQHYVLGHGDTFLNDYWNRIPNIQVEGVSQDMVESNDVCGHIGAAGAYQGPMNKFLYKHRDKFTDLLELEKPYANIFNWCLDGTFE